MFAACVFLLPALFLQGTVDVHVDDTYYVLSGGAIFYAATLICAFFWLLYVVTNRLLFSRTLTWVHTLITILSISIILLALHYAGSSFSPGSRRYFDFSAWGAYESDRNIALITAMMILLFAAALVIFFINLLKGIFATSR